MGHSAPFDFVDEYVPAPGMARFRSGTPSLIAFAALEGALDLWEDINLTEVRRKSVALSDLFITRLEALGDTGLALASPREAVRRGSHVALTHPQGYALIQALIARGVIGDFRAPDIVRFGFTPLTLRYTEVWEAATIVGEVLAALPCTGAVRRGTVT
jgi:kynureninase